MSRWSERAREREREHGGLLLSKGGKNGRRWEEEKGGGRARTRIVARDTTMLSIFRFSPRLSHSGGMAECKPTEVRTGFRLRPYN